MVLLLLHLKSWVPSGGPKFGPAGDPQGRCGRVVGCSSSWVLRELLGKGVGGSEIVGLPKCRDCLRQWDTEMKRNEEMVAADCLWCSYWRTASRGVSAHQVPGDAGICRVAWGVTKGRKGAVTGGRRCFLWWGWAGWWGGREGGNQYV